MEAQTLEMTCDGSGEHGAVTSATGKREIKDSAGPQPRLSAAGAGALLFDPGTGLFDKAMQARLLAVAKRIEATLCATGTAEVVLGVNNLLLIFNPLDLDPDEASDLLLRWWETTEAESISEKVIEIPVIYGGAAGEDLVGLSSSAGLTIDEYVHRHSDATYTVACIGSMPGFAYMTGLPAELAVPRRKVPRMKVEQGSVIIGGAQAGVMSCTGPSGWHLLGRTDVSLFDAKSTPPCLFKPGDQVRFVVKGIEA